jgi:hypothetical protein
MESNRKDRLADKKKEARTEFSTHFGDLAGSKHSEVVELFKADPLP